MRRALYALALLPLLLLGTLWAGPYFTDWDARRGQLAEIAAVRLGRAVTLDGKVSLVLLPRPVLEAAGVTIGGNDPALAVRARALRLRLGVRALLAGRIELRELAVVGADISLPWPPGPGGPVRPPSWLSAIDARIEDSRLTIGGLTLEGINGRVTSDGAADALRAEGRFSWRGLAVRVQAALGRAGFDGVAPFDLALATADAALSARGVLASEGGFEGTVDASGGDLSQLLPAPPTPFRAQGRLSVSAALAAADDLQLDLGGAAARGAIALRLDAAPRLDVALAASRLDLEAWVTALRGAAVGGLPIGVDLSAEAASWRGVALRRLRGGAFLEAERLTLSDVSFLLPGDTEVELAGATAAGRLEAALRVNAPELRATLLALGVPLGGTDPAVLRRAEGRFRLTLEETQASVAELAGTLDGAPLSGAGVLRFGARPALGIGLTAEHFDLSGYLPAGLDWAGAAAALGGFDANIRLAVERLTLHGFVLAQATLDAALEGGRLTVRRLAGQFATAQIAASGAVTLAATPRFADLVLEAGAPAARPLLAQLPGNWADAPPLADQPLSLRLAGGGAADALALSVSLELGALRAEAMPTIDLREARASGSLTLRHPGAPRLLAELRGVAPGAWLGEGSFSLVANLAATHAGVSAESFELIAAGLRAGGQLALSLDGPRPRLVGRIAAAALPLPALAWRDPEPFGFGRLGGWDAELALSAARIEPVEGPLLEQASATLRLAGNTLRLDNIQALVSGGTLQGGLRLDVAATPQLALAARLAGVAVSGPVFGLPFDLSAGRLEAEADLAAAGHSMAGLLASLRGTLRLAARDGVLAGFDLAAASRAAGLAETDAAAAALRQALSGGATAFETFMLQARLAEGRAALAAAGLTAEGGSTATATGDVDVARGTLDVGLAARVGEGPEVGLRITGPAGEPRRLPELAAWLRWRAER